MVTCCERAVLLAVVGDVYCIFVTLPCGILGQVWYLTVLFPDLGRLSYLHGMHTMINTLQETRSATLNIFRIFLFSF